MKRLTYDEFAEIRDDSSMRLIDVREIHEFEDVHVKGAQLFPLSQLQRGELPEEDDRDTYVICRSGARSQTASKILENSGWRECTNVDGGTLAAIEAGPEHVES